MNGHILSEVQGNDVCCLEQHETTHRLRLYTEHTYWRLRVLLAPLTGNAQKRAARERRRSDAQQALAVQVALDRAGFSPGEIDGQSRAEDAARAVGVPEIIEPAAERRRERGNTRGASCGA